MSFYFLVVLGIVMLIKVNGREIKLMLCNIELFSIM